MLQLLTERNLADTFSETVLLLKAINTILFTSCEAERYFATLMLSIQNSLVRGDSVNFNQNIIDMFALLKNRRAKFFFK